MSFDDWKAALDELALDSGLAQLVSVQDDSDLAKLHEDGLTPEEAIDRISAYF